MAWKESLGSPVIHGQRGESGDKTVAYSLTNPAQVLHVREAGAGRIQEGTQFLPLFSDGIGHKVYPLTNPGN
jgi:hypothetical protein